MSGKRVIGIGISGMGRIGRLVLRKLMSENQCGEHLSFRIVAINAVHSVASIAHLLKYDSTHGKFDASIEVRSNHLVINDQEIRMVKERDPANIPWDALGVQVVIDATGRFNTREGALLHLNNGAHKVIITAPGKEMDFTSIMGVNENHYDGSRHHMISVGSCTTNCVAPLLHVLDQSFGVQEGWVTTVHAYTNDQNHLDNPHEDFRRARSCVESIIPTETGINRALKDVLPHVAERIQGISLRVPVQDVSLADMTLSLHEAPSAQDVIQAFTSSKAFGEYIDVCHEPLVSVDFIGSEYSAIVDGLTMKCLGRSLKLLAWYDNEWGYACRVADMTQLICRDLQSLLKLESAL